MNRSNLIALLIAIAVYLGPFYYLFIRNNGGEIVDTGPEMLIGVSWIVGTVIAMHIAFTQPFGKKAQQKAATANKAEVRKAA